MKQSKDHQVERWRHRLVRRALRHDQPARGPGAGARPRPRSGPGWMQAAGRPTTGGCTTWPDPPQRRTLRSARRHPAWRPGRGRVAQVGGLALGAERRPRAQPTITVPHTRVPRAAAAKGVAGGAVAPAPPGGPAPRSAVHHRRPHPGRLRGHRLRRQLWTSSSTSPWPAGSSTSPPWPPSPPTDACSTTRAAGRWRSVWPPVAILGSPHPSVLESRMARLFRLHRLPRPKAEVVWGPNRRYRLDFAYPHLRLAIEVDGWSAHFAPEQQRHDNRRGNALARAGWTVLHYDWWEVTYAAERVAAEIADTYTAPDGRRLAACPASRPAAPAGEGWWRHRRIPGLAPGSPAGAPAPPSRSGTGRPPPWR